MNFFTQMLRTLLLAAVLAVGAVCLSGCGGNKDASSSEKSEQGAVSVKTGEFTDSRDGQKYRIVKIGKQVWMAENLRFETLGNSGCIDCDKYGRLYSLDMAKIACPKGWHLPSKEEWTKLVTVVGSETAGKKLKSTSGWNEDGNGTDEYGFSALPGGLIDSYGNRPGEGRLGRWWVSAEDGSNNVYYYYRSISVNKDDVGEYDDGRGNGHSVRCLKD